MMNSGPFPFLSHEAKGRDSTSFRGLSTWDVEFQMSNPPCNKTLFFTRNTPNSATSRCGKKYTKPMTCMATTTVKMSYPETGTIGWTPSEKKTYHDPLEIHYVDSGLCFLDHKLIIISNYLQVKYSQSLQIIYTLFSTIFKNFFL